MQSNEHHDTEIGNQTEGRDKNIKIIGEGKAVLDGGNYNGLCERNCGKDGLPMRWKNNLLLFTNVENFEIAQIKCQNQRWWALNFVYCSFGEIHDIEFCYCDTGYTILQLTVFMILQRILFIWTEEFMLSE